MAHVVPVSTLRNQQNAGVAAEHKAPGWGETSQQTGSTELSAANSPWDLSGHLAP